MSKFYFEQPKLREGSELVVTADHLKIAYRGEEFDIYPDEQHTLEQISRFLQMLDGSRTVEQLKAQSADFSPEEIAEFLEMLDESWLLADAKQAEIVGKNGLTFLLELEDLYRDWEKEFAESELATAFYEGRASKELVIGVTFEYYHITKRAHDCITPAIAKGHGAMQRGYMEFFHEEYRHDKLLLQSLHALGYTKEQVVNSIPLAYTAALSNQLAKWAHTDLLTFMASLFIWEGTNFESAEYIESLEEYDFPKEFANNQKTHSDINIEGEHGNVSREFFSQIAFVSPEDQKRVIQNLRLLVEMRARVETEMYRYYSAPDAVIPRLFAQESAPSFTMEQLLAEAQAFAAGRTWKASYQEFWNQLETGELDSKIASQTFGELLDYKRRFVGFGSSVLHRNIQTDVMYAVSRHYIITTRIEIEQQVADELPLPALEAIANQMLYLAESDPAGYLIATALIPQHVFKSRALTNALAVYELGLDKANVQKYLEQLAVSTDLVEEVKGYFAPLTAEDRVRIMNNVFILLEMSESLVEELTASYTKWQPAEALTV